MSKYLVKKADELIAVFKAFRSNVPVKLTWHLDYLLKRDRLVEIVGEDFAAWLIIFNIVQDRLLYRPQDFGDVCRKLTLDPKWPQPSIAEEEKFPACLDVHQWNAAVERYRRSRRS